MDTHGKIATAVCVLGMVMSIIALIWVHKTPEEMAEELLDRPQKTYEWFYQNPFKVAGVPADEYERCLEWAFGEDIVSVIDRLWPARWNERHSDIFTMYGSDPVQVSLIAVGQAYCNRPQVITIEGGEGLSIIDCTFVEAEPYFVCPKCQSTALLGKPRPVTIKRKVGAVAEVIVDWFCNDCGYPVDSELERN